MKVSVMLVIWLCLAVVQSRADVYLILYATYNGHTGHCGIAVDEYRIRVQEHLSNGNVCYSYDTITTGALLYYDFWPLEDRYKGNYEGNVDPRYFKLPSQRWRQMISLRTLQDQGIPHKYGYPCDAIVAFPTSRAMDMELMQFLEDKMDAQKPFNAMYYNCCDYVAEALTFVTGRKIDAKEFIIKDYISTPNALYKAVSGWPEANILLDPGYKVRNTFVEERIVGRILPLFGDLQLFIISNRL